MKFKVGDRVKYYNNEYTGIIIKKDSYDGWLVEWDNGKKLNHYEAFLILLPSSDYADFLERIKDRMG